MGKVTELSKEQWAKVPVYLKKWLDIGHDTSKIDRDKAKDAVTWAYEFAGNDAPKYFIFLDSPMACQLAANLIKNTPMDEPSQLNSQLDSQLRSQPRSQLDSQLRSQPRSQLGSQLYSHLGSQLNSQLYSELYSQLNSQLDSQLGSQFDSRLYSQINSQLFSQLYSQLGSQLDSQLYSQLRSKLRSKLNSQLRSQKLFKWDGVDFKWYWSDYYGFYDFILNEIFPDKKDSFPLLKKVHEYLRAVSHVVAFKNIVFISDNPCKILKDEQGRLHSEDSQALEYRDGWGIYALDGVTISKEVFDLVQEKKDADKIMAIENVEHRLVAMKYFGVGNMRGQLNAKTLDKSEIYELYEIDLMGRREKVLRMKNPSEDKWHDEFVPPETKDIKDALRIRWGLDEYVEPLFRA